MTTDKDPTIDALVEDYLSLKPIEFCRVERLEIRQDWEEEGGCIVFLDMVIAPDSPTDRRRLLLAFEGVVNWHIAPGRAPLYACPLAIYCIKDRQWEGVNYHVRELEQDDSIDFLCRSFTAKVVSV